jgi:hypothetical protein
MKFNLVIFVTQPIWEILTQSKKQQMQFNTYGSVVKRNKKASATKSLLLKNSI